MPNSGKIFFFLSVEGPSDERLTCAERLNGHRILWHKKFLWQKESMGISFYIGNGSESDAGDIVNSVSAAVDGLPNLTAFLEEMHDPTTFSQWHCWHHGNHSWIDAADGLLYESELDLPDLLIDMGEHPERYQ